MMLYCPPNTTVGQVWVNHGTSQCFMETVAPSIVTGFLILFGSLELRMYKTYGTQMMRQTLPDSNLYHLQMFLTCILPIIAVCRFVLQVTVLNGGTVYGYMIISLLMTVIAYCLSAGLIFVERNYQLPSVPPQGHGIILLLFWTMVLIIENLSFLNLRQQSWWFHLTTLTDKIEMSLFVLRYVACLLVFILGLKAPGIMKACDYYANAGDNPMINESRGMHQGSTFRNAWKKLKTLFPFLWPKRDLLLQIRVLVCILLLAGGRAINLYVPIYSKLIVDSMTGTDTVFRWDLVLMYVLFKFLQGGGTGGMGLLNNMRSFLWIRIQQYTTREIELNLFSHLHRLSLRWHLCRKTGEVLRVMDRGTDSIFNLLNYILFSILPTIIDIIVAVVFFISAFNGWFGLIVSVTMGLYILVTICVTEWRTKFQRSMNLADNAQKARSVDSLLNFETVKYYGTEEYEVDCFRDAICHFQNEEWKAMITLNILNTFQNFIVCSGLIAGSLLCVYLVVNDKGLTVGDYVLFASYIIQLYVPLNWFGTYYRAIQKNFVDMENMFDLLHEEQEVRDVPNATSLTVRAGHVVFDDVCFSYVPEKQVLRNVSFSAPPGHTIALVGPSGSGKSTIIRLLFRFYDVDSGIISIDGANISKVTQESLRKEIGVVPQDTVLFNNTIRYNIQYGNLNANEEDVMTAAKFANIHHKIVTFPDRYDTQVGERGLKLSGGEKQRIAIARTMLKAPSILLLDEATSALDTETERFIQEALSQICVNKTTIIVAHRLSTIIHANEILVLREGEIVERGSHRILLEQEGMYYNMWEQQLKNEESSNDRAFPEI